MVNLCHPRFVVTPQIESIAVLTDLSANMAAPLSFASSLAQQNHASIVLAHAYIPLPSAFAAPTAALVEKSLEVERRHLADALEKEQRDFFPGIRSTHVLVEGSPKDMLTQLKGADLIVVGTSGTRGLEKVAFGSTAEAVFRSSAVPVLTVGPHCSCSSNDPEKLPTVLFATDFMAGVEQAISYALLLAHQQHARLVLLNAAATQEVPPALDQEAAKEARRAALEELLPQDYGLTPAPICVVEFGTPSQVILDQARSWNATMIVMGAHPSHFAHAASHTSGGLAYHVAAAAQCPVFIVPERCSPARV
ncbi:MAG TPA: universal stress protein [Acidobacteriaceae bacterium]|nr:universal stress protein [Acidobacteriaceae bacterium]